MAETLLRFGERREECDRVAKELRGGLSLGLGGHRSAAARGLGVDIN